MKSTLLRKALVATAVVMVATPMMANAASVNVPTTPDPNTEMAAPQDQAKGEGPVAKNYFDASMKVEHQLKGPKGANDWACKPTKERPNPVILVHGWGSSAYSPFSAISPMLKDRGYCVFAMIYGSEKDKSVAGIMPGFNGMGDTWTSAMQLRDYVAAVRKATGAQKVDLVAWSQGGLIAQTYLNFYNGGDRENPARNKVAHAIYMGGAHHGTTMSGLAKPFIAANDAGKHDDIAPVVNKLGGTAALGMIPNSEVVKANLAAGDTIPGITYTVISSETDMVLTPIEQTWLKQGPGATVNNVSLQKGCEVDHADHHAMVYDPRAWDYILIGLGEDNVQPRCVPVKRMIAQGF